MKQFLKFMPLAAALLFATSCDKDENNDTKSDNGLVTVPFTVKVETGSKVSKIAYAENQGAFTPSFETSEVGTLTMSLTSEDLSGTLTLANINGTFSGDLEMTAEQKEQFDEGKIKFVGTIGTALPAPVPNNTSLKNLIEECAHQYKTAEFASNVTTGIGLTDQNSYLAITWTNKGGASVEFTINGSEMPVSITLNEDGQGWIAVPGGATVACADLEITSATTTVGKIHNISRTFSAVPAGYVDLGVTVGTQHIYFEKSDTYDHGAWQADQEYWPTVAEWTALKDQCYWKLADDNGGYYVFKAHDNNDAGKVTNQESTYTPSVAYSTATEPYIFLPVTGGDEGYYWSSESNGGNRAFCLCFRPLDVHPDGKFPKVNGMPGVVTVRRSN